MKQLKNNKNAFSLVEVIVATVIFLTASIGIFSVFSMAQKSSVVTEKDIVAANFGRQILEDLRAQVDSRTWDTAWPADDPLTCEVTPPWRVWPGGPPVGFSGTVKYKCFTQASAARKVTIQLIW